MLGKLHINLAQEVPDLLVLRLNLCELLKVASGGLMILQLDQVTREEKLNIPIVRIEGQRPFQCRLGFRISVQLIQGNTKQRCGGRHFRIEFQPLLQNRHSLVVLALLEIKEAEVVVSGAQFGVDPQDFVVLGFSLREIAVCFRSFGFGIQALGSRCLLRLGNSQNDENTKAYQ